MHPLIYMVNALADEISDIVHKELTRTSPLKDHMYIDCKYYTTSAPFRLISDPYSRVDVRGLEALLICFDPASLESWKVACDWQKYGKEEDVPIQLLVCKSLSDDNIRAKVFTEATNNHFEVVQLSPHPSEIEDEEYGVARIKAALVAHRWPNLKLKISENEVRTSVDLHQSDKKAQSADLAKQVDDGEEVETDEDFDDEEFSSLFPKLMEMRTKAVGMDREGRRKMAEKLTVRFWKALKLDEEEIMGLSDDGED